MSKDLHEQPDEFDGTLMDGLEGEPPYPLPDDLASRAVAEMATQPNLSAPVFVDWDVPPASESVDE